MNFLSILAEKQPSRTDTWKTLFEWGVDARANEMSFDVERAEAWKRGWIAADIQLGMLEEQEP